MKHIAKKLMIIVLSVALTGCFSAVKVKPETKFMLNAVPDVPVKRAHPITLLVLQPVTDPVYDTTQMAYSLRPYQIAYYENNRWAETPGEMLQPLMMQTLQNTHYFHAVLTSPVSVGRFQYALSTQILQLKQDYTQRPALLRFTVRAELTRIATSQVVATKEFVITRPMHQYSPYGGVYAANRATSEFLEELARFCIKHSK